MAKISGTPAGPTRLGYTMATGGSLPGTDTSSKTTPRFARGGAVKGTTNFKNDYKGAAVKGSKAGGFKQGVLTSAAKNVGTVKTTNNVKGMDPKGFKLHAPKKI